MKEKDMFLGTASKKDGKITIIPIPYEGACSAQRGTAEGPEAIIKASLNLELYDDELGRDISKIGIRTMHEIDPESTPEEMVDEIEAVIAKELLKNNFPVIIGGCHTVTIGAVKAMRKRFNNFSVLSLDAHADLKDKYDDTRLSHACVMARINELCRSVTAGVRSLDKNEAQTIRNSDNPVFFAREIVSKKDWHEKAISSLSENVYITIDLDVFDPSIMASTGTPEPGGMLWYELLEFLKKVCKKKNIIGFDIVELKPRKDEFSCDFLAAKLVYKMLGYCKGK